MKRLLPLIFLFLFFSCAGTGGDDNQSSGVPSVPTGIKISSQTSHSVVMVWDAVDGAESYNWKLDEGSASVKNGTTRNTNIIIDGLSQGHTYLFAIQAVSSSGSSEFSAAVTIDFGGGSTGPVTPNPGTDPSDGTAICVDSPLLLELSSTPELGSSGFIRVFDSADNQVDAIDLADLATVTIREDGQMIPKSRIYIAEGETPAYVYNTFMDAPKCASRWRPIHYTPLRLRAKALEIKLHSGVLDFGKEYYLTIDKDVIKDHPGLSKGDFTFKTKAKPTSNSELSVRQDGKGDFCTVQGAVSYSAQIGKSNNVVISIASGTYNETVFIRDKNNLTLKGESRDNTVIAYANNESYEGGSGSSATSKPVVGQAIPVSGGRGVILAESCDNLCFENLSMKNTFGQEKGQAEVIYFNSNNKLVIENCALHSLQDTFLCKGSVYVHNSLIAGHCDFIWGYPNACLFEDCEIRAEAAGYIVQARVQNASDKGFVFLNCRLTAASGVKDGSMYLARSAGQSNVYDNVTFVNCTMSPVIAAAGWYGNPAPNPATPTATSGWKEYGSKNASGAALNAHSSHGRYLTADEAAPFSTKSSVLGW